MVGEAASSADQARAYSWFAQGSQMALLLGPLIGGGFVRPADKWPVLRSIKLLTDYPYALPGLILGCLTLINTIVNAFLLNEVRVLSAGVLL
jgi:MFS family permease